MRLRLLELERRIDHLQLIQEIQRGTIETQDRTIGYMNGTIVDLKATMELEAGMGSWARTPSLLGR